MDDKSQLSVGAFAKYKCLVNDDLLPFCIGEVNIAHGDRDVAVDLDAILGGIVVVADIDPVLEREARIFGEGGIAADEIGESAGLGWSEGVGAVG